MILFERRDIALNGLANIRDSFLTSLALTDSTREAGALRNKVLIFTGIDDYLSHGLLRAVCLNNVLF